jgi:hypothetical protein
MPHDLQASVVHEAEALVVQNHVVALPPFRLRINAVLVIAIGAFLVFFAGRIK